jgi:hypothetical protein
MLRRTPMTRGSGFKRPVFMPVATAPPRRVERSGVIARVSGIVAPIEKENALQHKSYMALVRKLPCAHCGIVGFSQFCHADMGKGTGIKTDSRRGWPGCRPHGDTMGCHYLIGSTGTLGQAERRRLEEQYGVRTREAILGGGVWPARLPLWNQAQ